MTDKPQKWTLEERGQVFPTTIMRCDKNHLSIVGEAYKGDDSCHIADVSGLIYKRANEAIANRIKECFNGCRGIKDPEQTIAELVELLDRLRAFGGLDKVFASDGVTYEDLINKALTPQKED